VVSGPPMERDAPLCAALVVDAFPGDVSQERLHACLCLCLLSGGGREWLPHVMTGTSHACWSRGLVGNQSHACHWSDIKSGVSSRVTMQFSR